MNANPGFRFSTKVEDFIARNLTPPYLTSQADVRHVDLESLEASESCLIMFSDGLIDLYGEADRNVGVLAKLCVQVVGRRGPMDPQRSRNSALSLLREGLGGLDIEKVSRMITVEMLQRWMDDTTIIVQWL
jgi:pyruvate dehydrogenase phosphatase